MTKQIAIRTEVNEDLHVKFKSICALEGISLKDKTALLIEEYVKQKEKK